MEIFLVALSGRSGKLSGVQTGKFWSPNPVGQLWSYHQWSNRNSDRFLDGQIRVEVFKSQFGGRRFGEKSTPEN